MNIWPWSRFAKFEQEIKALYIKLDESEYAELDLQDQVRELEVRLDTSTLARNELTERCIDQSNKLLQTTADYNVMRAKYRLLEAEINSAVRPDIVLKPPTKHAPRHDHKNLENNPGSLGSHEPLEGLTSPWPFPTVNMYEDY